MGLLDFLTGKRSGLGVEELARRTGVSVEALRSIRPAYRKVEIPKRRGGRRVLQIPEPELKAIQRRILHRVLARLKVHPRAVAYRRGFSIVGHASLHAGKEVVVTLDLKDFFACTPAARVQEYCRRVGWSKDAAAVLTQLTTWEESLPQGAPTSPMLSNLVNFKLDARLEAAARRFGAAYSRYADDMAFSKSTDVPREIGRLIRCVKLIVENEGYTLHQGRKLHIRRRHQCQVVGGLVVNQRPNLRRKQRRLLRAVRHHMATNRPATLSESQLKGWESLEFMIRRQSS
ncbi:MAG: RNA-directed DNA polymerase [Phycisphaerales bacterium]|nr:RNA-directed DNA polymerase [Phycisphaerales bacterium]